MWAVYLVAGAFLFAAVVLGGQLHSAVIQLAACAIFIFVISWAYSTRR